MSLMLDRPRPVCPSCPMCTFMPAGGSSSSAASLPACSPPRVAAAAKAQMPPWSLSSTPPGGAFPVTIEHKYGSTEIPAEPRG